MDGNRDLRVYDLFIGLCLTSDLRVEVVASPKHQHQSLFVAQNKMKLKTLRGVMGSGFMLTIGIRIK